MEDTGALSIRDDTIKGKGRLTKLMRLGGNSWEILQEQFRHTRQETIKIKWKLTQLSKMTEKEGQNIPNYREEQNPDN